MNVQKYIEKFELLKIFCIILKKINKKINWNRNSRIKNEKTFVTLNSIECIKIL